MLLRPPGNAPSSLSHPPRIGFLPQTNRYEAVCRLRGRHDAAGASNGINADCRRDRITSVLPQSVFSSLLCCFCRMQPPFRSLLSAISHPDIFTFGYILLFFIFSLYFYIYTISVKCIHFTYKTPSRSGNCCLFSFPKCREGFLLMWDIASFLSASA